VKAEPADDQCADGDRKRRPVQVPVGLSNAINMNSASERRSALAAPERQRSAWPFERAMEVPVGCDRGERTAAS